MPGAPHNAPFVVWGSGAVNNNAGAPPLPPAFGDRVGTNVVVEFLFPANAVIRATQLDGFRRLLDTVPLTMNEFAWALLPPIALLLLWEAGKILLRRSIARAAPVAAGVAPMVRPEAA